MGLSYAFLREYVSCIGLVLEKIQGEGYQLGNPLWERRQPLKFRTLAEVERHIRSNY